MDTLAAKYPATASRNKGSGRQRLDPVGSPGLMQSASSPALLPQVNSDAIARETDTNDDQKLPRIPSKSPGQSQASWASPHRSGSRWHRNVAGRWPCVHKADAAPAQPGRVRTLICNWPTHFCKESLIMVPAGSEPVGAPYRMVVMCDLRRRKDELQKKHVYLVAYDVERLRKYGSGMGLDPHEASNSFLARDCICSDIVSIKSMYGEVQITLHPPDTAEGNVLVLLRVVKTSNLKDMQDWNPIGDAVVINVEPRITREDKEYIHRLRGEMYGMQQLGLATRHALDRSQEDHAVSLKQHMETSEGKAQDILRELQRALSEVVSDLPPGPREKIQKALDESKNRQKDASHSVNVKTQQDQLEVHQKAVSDTRAQLARQYEQATVSDEAERGMRGALDNKFGKAQSATTDDRKHSEELRRAQKAARAAQITSVELRTKLASAESDAKVCREGQAKAEAALKMLSTRITPENRAALDQFQKANASEAPKKETKARDSSKERQKKDSAPRKAQGSKERVPTTDTAPATQEPATKSRQADYGDDDFEDDDEELKRNAQAAVEAALLGPEEDEGSKENDKKTLEATLDPSQRPASPTRVPMSPTSPEPASPGYGSRPSSPADDALRKNAQEALEAALLSDGEDDELRKNAQAAIEAALLGPTDEELKKSAQAALEAALLEPDDEELKQRAQEAIEAALFGPEEDEELKGKAQAALEAALLSPRADSPKVRAKKETTAEAAAETAHAAEAAEPVSAQIATAEEAKDLAAAGVAPAAVAAEIAPAEKAKEPTAAEEKSPAEEAKEPAAAEAAPAADVKEVAPAPAEEAGNEASPDGAKDEKTIKAEAAQAARRKAKTQLLDAAKRGTLAKALPGNAVAAEPE